MQMMKTVPLGIMRVEIVMKFEHENMNEIKISHDSGDEHDE